jgi:hypothetical protein
MCARTHHAAAEGGLAAGGDGLLLLDVAGLVALDGVEGRFAALLQERVARLRARLSQHGSRGVSAGRAGRTWRMGILVIPAWASTAGTALRASTRVAASMFKNGSLVVAPGRKESVKREERSKEPVLRGGEKEVLTKTASAFCSILECWPSRSRRRRRGGYECWRAPQGPRPVCFSPSLATHRLLYAP